MLDIKTEDWVAVIEVEDFSPLSRADATFARELRDAVVDLADDDSVKAIILRATGGDFAPATPAVAPEAGDIFTGWSRDFAGAAALYQSMTFSKKVIITEVAGQCSGAGSMLVLSSDLTVAAVDAAFASPFSDHPEANFVLSALTIRLNRTKSWLIRDNAINAHDAHAFGLVNTVVPRAELGARTEVLARSVARMPLDGVVMSKMLQQAVLDSHGVGREFDMAGFYAAGLLSAQSTAQAEEAAKTYA